MSMMNANAAATTTMTANEPLDFELPEMGDSDFSNDELAEDMVFARWRVTPPPLRPPMTASASVLR